MAIINDLNLIVLYLKSKYEMSHFTYTWTLPSIIYTMQEIVICN